METEILNWLRDNLPEHLRLNLGIGDDAAILDWSLSPHCLITTDMLSDDVDFRWGIDSPHAIGHKALAVNLSDLAAMAVKPVAAVIAIAIPHPTLPQDIGQLFEGILSLASQFDVAIAGGDLQVWDGPLSITITALGEPTQNEPLRRAGAQPGDGIIVTGAFGGSILGRHLDFLPRVQEALLLNSQYLLHAAIDVSDGLSLDLARLCEESRCGAVIDLETIPVTNAARQLATSSSEEKTALEHALGDGEDFELILTGANDEINRLINEQPLKIPVTRIGTITKQLGLWNGIAGVPKEALQPRGYVHGQQEMS